MPVWTCHWRRRRFASLMARARSSGRRKWLPSLRLWWAIFRAQLDPITYVHLASPSREAQMNRFVWRCLRKALPRGRGFNDAYTRVHGRPRAETDDAAPFPAQPAFRAPDGPHAGAPRPHPPPARRRAQHRGAPRHRRLARGGTRRRHNREHGRSPRSRASGASSETACGWPTTARIRGPCSSTSGIRTSSARCATPSSQPIASNPSGRMRLRLVLAVVRAAPLPYHRPLSSAFRLQASYP